MRKKIAAFGVCLAALLLCSFTVEECALADKLTIITTTSPVPSNPDTTMIKKCLESYLQVPSLRGCKMIIVFDGVPMQQSYRTLAYELFIQNVQKMVAENPAFANTRLVINREHKHLANSLREAIKIVDTPYILVHQHDFALIRPFDAVNLIKSMDRNPHLKMVRFNKWANIANWWDGQVDAYIEGGALVPLTRTFGWSDNDHIARLDYYTDFVLPKVTWNGAMEWFLHDQEKIIKNHLEYGTYLYGAPGEASYLDHLDGRTFR